MGKIKKSIRLRLRRANDIEKCFKPFTLGGSLIPPHPREGYRHPSRGGGLRAASRVYIRLSEGRQCKKQGVGPGALRGGSWSFFLS